LAIRAAHVTASSREGSSNTVLLATLDERDYIIRG
jgi:hypothetical protein